MSAGGTKIKGRYQILEVIGHGGMGLVYKVYDEVVKREVALKTIRDVPSRLALDLFRKECGVLATMTHPNIVEIFDVGEFEHDGGIKPYLVMPLLPGVTLEVLIHTASQRLTVDRSIDIVVQTCRGLQAAHERGLVHRDIKPANIFVMPDDSVKIIDFGVAHVVAGTRSGMTLAGAGTLRYMSPEQAEMKPASPLSDIFSLGVVLYEALTGRRPFDGGTEAELIGSILRHVPPPVSDINPSVNTLISRTVHKAMAKQPWNRFASAREFADILQKAQRNESIEMFDSSKIRPRVERATKAFEQGNYQFASEILTELEAQGNIDTSITALRRQIDQAARQQWVGQLLDSARNCVEQEEYLLALQKVQEILQVEPNNTGALALKMAVETRRNEERIEEWIRLARQHLEQNAFSHARHALENVLQVQPTDQTALLLMTEVDRREQEYVKTREEKARLHDAAVEAWKSGDVSSALTKLERLLQLDEEMPETSSPERGFSYQNFYNQVRSEHDNIRSKQEEVRNHLVTGNFASALAICDEILAKYPGHALFQALKFDVEERQRQELSSRIAEIDRKVDSEPNLDRRVSILKEVLQVYPDEPHFRRALKLMREKRDLVNSIVARARAHEDNGQFAEALGQWDILETIYREYPGLDFEIERVMRRRTQQQRNEAKQRWIEQVDRHLGSAQYDRAIELVESALAEFPDDPELSALQTLAVQRRVRSAESQDLLTHGQQLCREGRFEEGLGALEQSFRIDDRNTIVRAVLLEALTTQARNVLDTDWKTAADLCARALEIDPSHGRAQSIQSLALDRRREESITRCTAEVRRMQVNGDPAGALARVEQGLAEWPNEPRLVQLRASLQKLAEEHERIEAAAKQAAAAAVIPAPPEPVPPPAPEVPPPPPPAPPPPARPVEARATVMLDPAAAPPGVPPVPAQKTRFTPRAVPLRLPLPGRIPARFLLAGVGAAVLLIGVVAAFLPVSVDIQTSPPGAQIRVDGTDRGSSDLQIRMRPGSYTIEAQRPGFQPVTQSVTLWPFGSKRVELTLAPVPAEAAVSAPPLPQALRVSTDLASGTVTLDDGAPTQLLDGQFVQEAIEWGPHTLKVVAGRSEAVFQFEAQPAGVPALPANPTTREMKALIVSGYGDKVQIRASYGPLDIHVDGQQAGRLEGDMLTLSNLQTGSHEVTIDDGKEQRKISFETGQHPLITAFINSDRNVGTLLIASNEDDARLIIDGKENNRWVTRGGQVRVALMVKEKEYSVRLVKQGFQEEPEQLVRIRKGEDTRIAFDLKPVPADASLAVRDAAPGTEVLLDDLRIGSVQADGTFTYSPITPGDHVLTFRAPKFKPRRISRTFRAGETVELRRGNFAMETAMGTVRLSVQPPEAVVTYRGEGAAPQPAKPGALELEEGSYTFTASARGHKEASQTIKVTAGETTAVALKLAAESVVRIPTMKEWLEGEGWSKSEDWYVRRGGGSILYPATPLHGTITFTAFRRNRMFGSERVRWVAGYTSPGDYILYEADQKKLYRTVISGGKRQKQDEAGLPGVSGGGDVLHTFQLEITPGQIIVRLRKDDGWSLVDAFSLPGRDLARAKFGFHIPGDDELRVTNFAYNPR